MSQQANNPSPVVSTERVFSVDPRKVFAAFEQPDADLCVDRILTALRDRGGFIWRGNLAERLNRNDRPQETRRGVLGDHDAVHSAALRRELRAGVLDQQPQRNWRQRRELCLPANASSGVPRSRRDWPGTLWYAQLWADPRWTVSFVSGECQWSVMPL